MWIFKIHSQTSRIGSNVCDGREKCNIEILRWIYTCTTGLHVRSFAVLRSETRPNMRSRYKLLTKRVYALCVLRVFALPCVSVPGDGPTTVCGARNRNLRRLCMISGTEGNPYISTGDRHRSTEETWDQYCIVQELPQIGGVWRTI